MSEFESERAYTWFARAVMHTCRFVHSDKVRAFLKMVLETSVSRLTDVKAGQIYYRAQYGCDWRTIERSFYADDAKYRTRRQTAFSAERMRPKAEFVGDGRANPSGIPYLYMANTPTTAMAEVRPWIGSPISLAHFRVVRDLSLVDCSRE